MQSIAFQNGIPADEIRGFATPEEADEFLQSNPNTTQVGLSFDDVMTSES
jgi:hypothetical protein